MKRFFVSVATLLIFCPCLFAQKPEHQSVAINFKDTTKRAIMEASAVVRFKSSRPDNLKGVQLLR